MAAKKFVIMRDSDPKGSLRVQGSSTFSDYFIRVGLGIFWECSCLVKDAKVFETRSAASKVLIANGKNREGWYVEALDRVQVEGGSK